MTDFCTVGRIHISTGNSKLGKLPNFSLPPIRTCPPGVPCGVPKQCYALNAWKMYANVRTCWTENFDAVTYAPQEAEQSLRAWLWEKQPEYFRLHVGGDFFDQGYFDMWVRICQAFPKTRFLVFTKAFELDMARAPENMWIYLSMWPGWREPSDEQLERFARAWMLDEKNPDPRIPEFAGACPGSCTNCKECWSTYVDKVFHKH